MNTSMLDMRMAEVRSTADTAEAGRMFCHLIGDSSERITVYYASPLATGDKGGMVAIPPVGTEIIVCSPIGSDKWFYMGSTFQQEPRDAVGDQLKNTSPEPIKRVDEKLYRERGIPQRTNFKGARGGGLTISEEYSPSGFNLYTVLKSETGKKIELNDNPHTDAIILDAGDNATLKLTRTPNPGPGKRTPTSGRAFEVQTLGPQKLLCQSELDLHVTKNGREINIINCSEGGNWGGPIKTKNVNMQSKNGDVNVFTQSESGRIFIECLNQNGQNQHIQIETNGEGGSIVIKTKGNILLDAEGDIDMNSGGNMNIRCGGSFNVQSGGDSVIKSANHRVDAGSVRLAEPASAGQPDLSITQESEYGNVGVTKY